MKKTTAEQDDLDTAMAVSCPGCGAAPGVPCSTIIKGIQMKWTHDSRFYVAAGWQHSEMYRGVRAGEFA